MKSYDDKTSEFIERVFERSDEILRQSQMQANENAFEQVDEKPMPCERKPSKILRFSYAIPGLCAAVIVLCVLSINKLSIEPNKDPDITIHDTTSVTTIESKTTVTSTTIVTENNTSTSTSSTTTTAVTTTSEPATTTDIEEKSDENEGLDDPIENTEEHEDVPIVPVIPEEPTVSTTKAAVQPTLCGDVNGDKSIDIEDASIIIYYVNNKDSTTWAECYKKNKASNSKLTAEQALANADAFKASDKREITREDAEAIFGHINGVYPNLPINELIEDD